MARYGSCVLVLGALTALVTASLLNGHIPDGFSEPWKLRLALAPLRLMDRMRPVVESIYGNPFVLSRQFESQWAKAPVKGVKTRDLTFDGVPVRLFVPEGGASSNAGLIFIHGGGFVAGSVDTHSEECGHISSSTGMSVLSIDYRLAPDHVYPAAFQDCLAATQHFLKHAAEFGVDPERIAIAGDSAGGTLSVAVALFRRDHKMMPALKAQVLIYPALQALDFNLPSYVEEQSILSKDIMVNFWLWYALGDATFNHILQKNLHTPNEIKEKYAKYLSAGDIPRDFIPKYANQIPTIEGHNVNVWAKLHSIFLDPYFSPGIADDLTNLPKTFIITVGSDPLRDEGILFALRLKSAGNAVTHNHYRSAFHSIYCVPSTVYSYPDFNETIQIRDDIRSYIVMNL